MCIWSNLRPVAADEIYLNHSVRRLVIWYCLPSTCAPFFMVTCVHQPAVTGRVLLLVVFSMLKASHYILSNNCTMKTGDLIWSPLTLTRDPRLSPAFRFSLILKEEGRWCYRCPSRCWCQAGDSKVSSVEFSYTSAGFGTETKDTPRANSTEYNVFRWCSFYSTKVSPL